MDAPLAVLGDSNDFLARVGFGKRLGVQQQHATARSEVRNANLCNGRPVDRFGDEIGILEFLKSPDFRASSCLELTYPDKSFSRWTSLIPRTKSNPSVTSPATKHNPNYNPMTVGEPIPTLYHPTPFLVAGLDAHTRDGFLIPNQLVPV